MDDLTLRYYDAEMRYLLEAGEEFARAHPEQAAMLNLDKRENEIVDGERGEEELSRSSDDRER